MAIKKLLIASLIFFAFTSPVRADLKSDYAASLSDYNSSLTEYKIAKSTYETYRTLSSLTKVLEKSKTFLEKRDALVIKHFELLQAKIDEMEFNGTQNKDALKEIIVGEITFFDNHRTLIPAISTVKDVNTVAKKAEDEITLANVKSKQILGNILVAKVNALRTPYNELFQQIQDEVTSLKTRGIRPQSSIDKLERWLVEVNNKRTLAENNALQNINDLDKLNARSGQDVEKKFDEIRINIIQGYLYLKEGTNFMEEILNEIKYE